MIVKDFDIILASSVISFINLMSENFLKINFRTVWNASLRMNVEKYVFLCCPDFSQMKSLNM